MAETRSGVGKLATDTAIGAASIALSKSKKVTVVCPICDSIIKETVGKRPGHDAIECNGSCSAWIHRQCAGLTKDDYLAASQTDTPFYCSKCRLDQHELEIQSLRDMVIQLSNKLNEACGELAFLKNSSMLTKQVSNNENHGNQTVDVTPSVKVHASRGSYAQVTRGSFQQELGPTISSKSPDRKSNLILYGIKEYDKGTPWLQRSMNDIAAVTSILTGLDQTIHDSSVVECKRLGKFKPDGTMPRPILAKMARPLDVMCVLAKKKQLSGLISIKPDMTREERNVENLLLKERRLLIESGINRKHIRIRQSALIVKGKLHARVTESTLEKLETVLEADADFSEDSVSIVSNVQSSPDAFVLSETESSTQEDSPSTNSSIGVTQYTSNSTPTPSPSSPQFTSDSTSTPSSPSPSLTNSSPSLPATDNAHHNNTLS